MRFEIVGKNITITDTMREKIEKKDVLEAVRFRNLEGGYWK